MFLIAFSTAKTIFYWYIYIYIFRCKIIRSNKGKIMKILRLSGWWIRDVIFSRQRRAENVLWRDRMKICEHPKRKQKKIANECTRLNFNMNTKFTNVSNNRNLIEKVRRRNKYCRRNSRFERTEEKTFFSLTFIRATIYKKMV